MTKEFNNAKIVAAANIYFGGKVTSRTVFAEDGKRYTLGVMLAGEYEFPITYNKFRKIE